MLPYDPQKLLPAPSPFNRPMSVWDPEALLAAMGDLMKLPYPAFVNQFYPAACPDFDAFPKIAKPVRYYIEGGHFDMQPKGTVSETEIIEFEGTPTGRRLTPFVAPIRERSHKVAVIHVGSDYGALEARILATLADKRVRGAIIDFDSPGGEISPQIELYSESFMRPKPNQEEVAKRQPPSYLRHDPTKRHSRRRKRK